MKKQHKKEVLKILEQTYGTPGTALSYSNPFELLVATVLSAQCTDERVNKVTPDLFARFGSPEAMSKATPEELEKYIKTCGLYRNKAKNLSALAKILVEKHQGQVPSSAEELMSLPGVGRKTANVVLSNAFNQDAIAVDTHVFRVANRIGLARAKDPLKTELALMRAIPQEKWSQAHHWLIYHGRQICKARNPLCTNCPITELCDTHHRRN